MARRAQGAGMLIKLIHPAMPRRPMDSIFKTRMSPPLALYTLVALTPEEHQTVVEDENVRPLRPDAPADLVGITATVNNIDRAVCIAAEYRRRGIPVVAGGVHISAVPDRYTAAFDALCIGPAERVWTQILSDAENGTLRKIYCDMDNFSGSEIVAPAYERIPDRDYLYTNIMITSKGCPFKCGFCYNSCPGVIRNHITRSMEDILSDIERIQSNHIMFVDDNFIGDIGHTRRLLPELKARNIRWNAAVSANICEHEDLLALMAECGCRSLFIGFESINQQSLRGAGKFQNHVDDYNKLLDMLNALGIMVNASIVFGLDEDDVSTFDNTLDWLVQNRVASATAHILTPYPGTRLYRKMESGGSIINFDYSRYTTSTVVFTPAKMTADELFDGYMQFYRKFYSFKNIWKRMPKSGNQVIPFLMFNLLYRKFGKAASALARVMPLASLGRFAARVSYKATFAKC
ncbi:MAG: B12-binding domain-containing radical SAM protein [Deltaproteobacteria bacterium]|jgi:radical SAM superfamily enzyme YgiQ (UPF0313 family)|nr:B12-binding domain-containing radical SAM protein [Deltaproteobacteria bacterium]